MNLKNSIVFLLLYASCMSVTGQKDSITVLDEVVLTDIRLLHFADAKKVETLTPSVLTRNGNSLTDLLRFNSSIYLKENGRGMLATPSFRGTGASQTAVVWNGININSQLTGQVDFNTLVPRNYGNVSMRSGGGSVQFGSGAIGGSIHLNDVFNFEEHSRNELALTLGSFDTKSANYKLSVGHEKMAAGLGINYINSENDYAYLDTDKKNENGAFETASINANIGYHLSEGHLLKLYHHTFLGNRDFSGTLTAPSNANYIDINSRNLLEWDHFKNRNIGRLKLAYLYEKYRYYPNKQRDEYSSGNTKSLLFDYDYKVQYKEFIVNALLVYTHSAATGNAITSTKRNTWATTLLMKHNLGEKVTYGIGLRKEFVSDFESPLVYSAHAKFELGKHYEMYVNGSKNYRIPTFNDIYWQFDAGSRGNPEVRPESAWQVEIGQRFIGNKYRFECTAFYIASDDLIQWRPDAMGIWMPVNVNRAENYGVEVSLNLSEKWGKHQLAFNNSYAYTHAKDIISDQFLMYSPRHKFTSNLTYSFGKWEFFHQLFFNDRVFITSDNSDSLSSYTVSNLGFGRGFDVGEKLKTHAQVQMDNLFNKNYQNVAYLPMPGRHITLRLTMNL
ncbi:TonB-dependent receptor [Pareuzebyella sediminis]|uniref:TonB-dependent receptor n=1 Tax=Pareuzebyella sediminis TaxID=2607998 RepID=UPI0011ED91F6|nr:TonB-dependent receptor [Pareuzebyella sediminis]